MRLGASHSGKWLAALLLMTGGCASRAPLDPNLFAPYPSFNGGSSYGSATSRLGWNLDVRRLEDEEGIGKAFRLRVLKDVDAAFALSGKLLESAPEDEKLILLLWALRDSRDSRLVPLAWEILERTEWNEGEGAAASASLILQHRLGPTESAETRTQFLSELESLARKPGQRANLGTLCVRQECLGDASPEIAVALAQTMLEEPLFVSLGRELIVGGPAGILSAMGDLHPWQYFLLAGRAAVPQLAENLFHESIRIRAVAQYCLEIMLMIRLKDEQYSWDKPLKELLPLKEGIVWQMKRDARQR